jgi:hypothetical protein
MRSGPLAEAVPKRGKEQDGEPMKEREQSVSNVFEGIQARNRGDSIEDNPYPVDSKNHESWCGGWRISDVLREDPPIDAELLDRLARRVHSTGVVQKPSGSANDARLSTV